MEMRLALITQAVQAFRADVRSKKYPSDEESYHLPKETRAGWKRCSSGNGRWDGKSLAGKAWATDLH